MISVGKIQTSLSLSRLIGKRGDLMGWLWGLNELL